MKNKFAIISACCAMFALISASKTVIDSCRFALRLCAETVIPSLLPFFIVSILLSQLGFPALLGRVLAFPAAKLFSVSGAGASALIIGLSGGYPMGAAYIADLRRQNRISLGEAEKLLAFCNNSGPAFIIGAMGIGVFHSARAGLILYASHISAAILTGLILPGKFSPEKDLSPAEPLSFAKALPEAVYQAVSSALNVCGFVVCFTVFTGLLDANGFLSVLSGYISDMTGNELHWAHSMLTGVFELGSAVGTMRGLLPRPENMALAAAILGWGGISVHFQTYAIISDTDIKGTLHFAGRLLSAAFAACIALLGAYFIRI